MNSSDLSVVGILQGVTTLLQHPNQLKDLKADPSIAKAFVEELCRFHTASAMAMRRVAKVDITLEGKVRTSAIHLCASFTNLASLFQHIKAGEGIICSNQSGNRDEDVFSNPDTFNMRRERGSEEALGYGWGAHRCIAEWLARAELEVVFGEPLFPWLTNWRSSLIPASCSYLVSETSELEAGDSFF